MNAYAVESRLCLKWHRCVATPHGERYPFNERHELEFSSYEQAQAARASLAKHNGGDFRVVEVQTIAP